MTCVKSPLRILLIALVLGWGADILFYGKAAGISVLIFVGLLLAALFGLTWLEKVRVARVNIWLVAPLLFFATMVFVRANGLLTFFNICAILALLSLLFFFYAADNIERLGMLGYPVVMLISVGHMLLAAGPVVLKGARDMNVQRGRFRLALPLVRGLLLAVPVLLVFTALLSSADSIFEGYVNNLFDPKFVNNLPELIWRFVFILVIAWLVGGGFLFALNRHWEQHDPKKRTENLPGTVLPSRILGFTEGVTILALVNLLFTVFAWIQFSVLFSGQAERTMNYTVYREYVRRGFGELLLAATLTMLLILGLRWATRYEKPNHQTIFNVLCTIMIGMALVLVVSSFQRMITWERIEFYINTQIRIYVRAFILWLALSFGWLLLTLWFKQARFAIGAFVAVLGFLITVNLLNPDVDVAQYNLDRYQSTQNAELATRYLWELSEDAVPTLVTSLNQTSGPVQRHIREHLSYRLAALEYNKKNWEGWNSFHLARWDAYETLQRLREAGKIDAVPDYGRSPSYRR